MHGKGMGKNVKMHEKRQKSGPGGGAGRFLGERGGLLGERGGFGGAGRTFGRAGRFGGAGGEKGEGRERVKISGPDCPGGQKMV